MRSSGFFKKTFCTLILSAKDMRWKARFIVSNYELKIELNILDHLLNQVDSIFK